MSESLLSLFGSKGNERCVSKKLYLGTAWYRGHIPRNARPLSNFVSAAAATFLQSKLACTLDRKLLTGISQNLRSLGLKDTHSSPYHPRNAKDNIPTLLPVQAIG